MRLWEYKIETVGGIFRLRSSKLADVRRICDDLGNDGWELVGVSYDWFVVQHVLHFKRPKQL
jgi:hypothetical protein